MWVHCSNLAAPRRKAHWGGGSRQVLADICGHSDQPATVNLQPYLYREKPTSVSASVGGLSVICNWIHFWLRQISCAQLQEERFKFSQEGLSVDWGTSTMRWTSFIFFSEMALPSCNSRLVPLLGECALQLLSGQPGQKPGANLDSSSYNSCIWLVENLGGIMSVTFAGLWGNIYTWWWHIWSSWCYFHVTALSPFLLPWSRLLPFLCVQLKGISYCLPASSPSR